MALIQGLAAGCGGEDGAGVRIAFHKPTAVRDHGEADIFVMNGDGANP